MIFPKLNVALDQTLGAGVVGQIFQQHAVNVLAQRHVAGFERHSSLNHGHDFVFADVNEDRVRLSVWLAGYGTGVALNIRYRFQCQLP